METDKTYTVSPGQPAGTQGEDSMYDKYAITDEEMTAATVAIHQALMEQYALHAAHQEAFVASEEPPWHSAIKLEVQRVILVRPAKLPNWNNIERLRRTTEGVSGILGT
jgi:hypothetical protein